MIVENEYVFSADKKIYYTKEAFKELLEAETLDGNGTIYRGLKVSYTHDDFVWVDKFLEIMEELVEDECYYEGEIYTDFSKQEKDDLQKVIVDWLVKNRGQPMCFGVQNIPVEENK